MTMDSKMNTSKTNAVMRILMVVAIAFTFFLVTGNDYAFANENDAAKLVGITATDDNGKALVEDGKTFVYLMMAVGFVIIAGCIVVAAIKLSAAGTGQKRVEAIMWVGGAFVGAFIVYKAFTLLGYAVNFGSS